MEAEHKVRKGKPEGELEKPRRITFFWNYSLNLFVPVLPHCAEMLSEGLIFYAFQVKC